MNQRPVIVLRTVAEVVDALGGPTKAGLIAGKSVSSMSNAANVHGRLKADCYLLMTKELERRGFAAPPELWGIKPAP